MSLQLVLDAATLNQIAAHGVDMAQQIEATAAQRSENQPDGYGRNRRVAALRVLLSCQSICSWKSK